MMIARVEVSQTMLATCMLTALKLSLKRSRKHILRSLREHGDMALKVPAYGFGHHMVLMVSSNDISNEILQSMC